MDCDACAAHGRFVRDLATVNALGGPDLREVELDKHRSFGGARPKRRAAKMV
jgi:hypothetical protein